uniref:Transposase n=1 Tax=Heterorhabditis bacteriophora TaxID=37862 RepID=A0A1I7XSP4_HETBA
MKKSDDRIRILGSSGQRFARTKPVMQNIASIHCESLDKDYMYMVSDLLLGGDLRYHLHQQGKFAEDRHENV